jgi:hypothetical protein
VTARGDVHPAAERFVESYRAAIHDRAEVDR